MTELMQDFSRYYEIQYSLLSEKYADPILIKRLKDIRQVTSKNLLDNCDIIHLDGLMSPKEKYVFKSRWNNVLETLGSKRKYSWFQRKYKRNLVPNIVAAAINIGSALKVDHTVIYVGVDTNHYKPMNVEKKYDLVIIGRMRPIKNHRLFLEICKKGNFSFITIGGTHRYMEGHVNDIEKMVRAQAREGRDYIPGFVEDDQIVRLINQARLGIVTSQSEGGPTCVQLMACGVPVISRNLEGTVEGLADFPDLIVSYDSPAEKYIEKIEKYLNDTDLRIKVRESVINNFDRTKTLQQYEELYNNILLASQ